MTVALSEQILVPAVLEDHLVIQGEAIVGRVLLDLPHNPCRLPVLLVVLFERFSAQSAASG